MDDRLLEPPSKIATAVAGRNRILWLAVRIVARALDTDVEMVVVPIHGPHLVEPGAIAACLATHRLLDGCIDEDALDRWFFGGRLDDGRMAGCPCLRVYVKPTLGDHHGCRHFLAFGAREFAIRHWGEPNIGIKPDLVTRVTGEHRAAARL